MSFKVGDKVWNILSKDWEIITEIDLDANSEFTIETNYEFYTSEGKTSVKHTMPTIYPNKFELVIPTEAYQKPLPKLVVNTEVIVWNDNKPDERYRRHYSSFTPDMRLSCFADGTTSFTQKLLGIALEHWDNYEIYEESDK